MQKFMNLGQGISGDTPPDQPFLSHMFSNLK